LVISFGHNDSAFKGGNIMIYDYTRISMETQIKENWVVQTKKLDLG